MERKTILLVDDERIIRHSLARDLTKENFEVSAASSGEEGIAKIDGGNFDLVITDLLMPGLDGFQVLKAAKRRNILTMVIILTGHADQKASIDALRLDADDFLEKPCDTDDLLFRISNCFTKQRLQKKVILYEKILTMCCYCRRIRCDGKGDSDKGQWYRLEEFIETVIHGGVSHGCCPDCFDEQIQKINLH